MLQVIKHKLSHIYQIDRSSYSSALVLSKNLPFHTKWTKSALIENVCFFPHFNNLFGHITTVLKKYIPDFISILSHSPIPQHSKTYLQSLETYLTSVKKANILSFLGTKSCLTEKMTPLFKKDSKSFMS